jgi:3-hydroxyisobutyrate dehydrogenase-like beta-hydroxyacid dehydrogenase
MVQDLENIVAVGRLGRLSTPKSAALQRSYDKVHHYGVGGPHFSGLFCWTSELL